MNVNYIFKYKERMESMWAKEINLEKFNRTFMEVHTKDERKAFWYCQFNLKNESCTILKSPSRIYHDLYSGTKIICKSCRKILKTKNGYNVAVKAPEMLVYWNYEKNGAIGLYPEYLTPQSNDRIFVKCDEHNWGIGENQTQICADFVNGHVACPYCNGKKATPNNNLKLMFPEVAAELHPDYNPEEILPFSSDIYKWFCAKCNDYYLMEVSRRTAQMQGCPKHKAAHHTSKTEQLLLNIMNQIVGGFEKVKGKGRQIELDLFNPKLKMAIEYDGRYHENPSQGKSDQNKNDRIKDDLNLFIRIREIDFPKLAYHDGQFEITCEKHRSSYYFLIPVISEIIIILNSELGLRIKQKNRAELSKIINENLRKTFSNSAYLKEDEDSFGDMAPGLLQLIKTRENINPYSVTSGSNHKFNCQCVNCSHDFCRSARNLINSRGKCEKCSHYVVNITDRNSGIERWMRTVPFEKSLQYKNPITAKYYSPNNKLAPTEIANKSGYPCKWNCPFCGEEYESTNKIQVTNGCTCTVCGKKAIEYNE